VSLLVVAICILKKCRNRTPDIPLPIQETAQPNGDAGLVLPYGAIGAAAVLLANNQAGQRDTSKGPITVLYTRVTIALQHSLAGGQGMISSNTMIASLSHNTPKSIWTETLSSR